MITTKRMKQITDDLMNSYSSRGVDDFTIDNLVRHGNSIVVMITRTYTSSIGGKHITTEKRVIVYRERDEGRELFSSSDMIAESTSDEWLHASLRCVGERRRADGRVARRSKVG